MPVFNLRNPAGVVIGQFVAVNQDKADEAAAEWGTAEFFSDPEAVAIVAGPGLPGDALLPQFTAGPNPDNTGPAIGPVVWSTVSVQNAIQPGAVTLTNGVDIVTETTIEGIGRRLETGFRPLRPDGSPAFVQQFLGGYLVDGNPLNVLLGGEWLPEQWAAIVPAIQSGEVPSPSILPAGEAPITASDGFAQFALPATGLAAAGILWAWWKRRKGK